MKKFLSIIALTMLLPLFACVAKAQAIWDAQHLAKVKEQIKQPVYGQAYRKLVKEANELLDKQPVSVMQKQKIAASGDKHDYMSQARYYWPDSTKADGLPYIQHDGYSNPEIQQLDRPRLAQMATRVTTLSLAFYFTDEERYAQKATEMLRVWFLDKATRMNPNLNYAQIVPGRDGNRGRQFGVLDAYSFVEMLDAVALLEQSQAYTKKDREGMKAWFTTFLDWMLTSKQGRGENTSKNNHGTAYDVQIIAYARYVGNKQVLEQFVREFTQKRIDTQIMPDGSQPLELKRTLSFGYSQYNLTHMLDVFLMAQHCGLEVGGDTKASLKKIIKAFDFLSPYLGKPVSAWPYKQISQWENKQQELCRDLYRASLLCEQQEGKHAGDGYKMLYRQYAEKNWSDRFTLLYYTPDRTDNGYASAESQLRFALKCVDKAKKTVDNQEKFSPRTMETDGSLRLVVPRDWCSGFFPGELWQMYAFTHKDEWRKAATAFTLPLRKMKDCRETHDLGFVVYNSYGRAYELTGDTAYANVLMDAARSLASRYNDKVGAIRSWDHHADVWKYPVIIDNMINLELLFEASRLSGDDTFRNIAIRHAETTMKNHFRKDGSCYHVVSYDPKSGKVEKKNTHQGLSHESVWSRGQGWALYGFTLCYRYTKRKDFLEQAKTVARFIFSQKNMPSDLVPYWDMNDPAIPNSPRDASAAAVVASGLYELATYVGKDEAKQYRKWADTIVNNLYRNYRSKVNQNQGFLLLHSVGNYPAHDEIDAPISYADYYYLEALWRKDFIK